MHIATRLAITAVSGIALMAGAPSEPARHLQSTAEDGDRRECPGPWLSIERVREPTIRESSAAGIYSQVPELHDCQRFIVNGAYGALFAVYSSSRLDSLDEDLAPATRDTSKRIPALPATDALPASTPVGPRVAVAAEVHSSHGTYDLLGVRPGFNCLYLSSENGWEAAYMVHTGHVTKCEPRGATNVEGGRRLHVRRVQYGGYADADYPPVARWVHSDGRYLIGLKCGNAWCEVGVPGGRRGAVSMALPPMTDAQRKRARVTQVPGWNDEQRIAEPKTQDEMDEGAYPFKPTAFQARAIPDPDLGAKTRCDEFRDWTPAGTIEMRGKAGSYKKLGLTEGTNQLFLKCVSEMVWQAKIVSSGRDETLLRVERWTHPKLKIPGTLRWRWQSNDETIWARCLEGCCQVQPM